MAARSLSPRFMGNPSSSCSSVEDDSCVVITKRNSSSSAVNNCSSGSWLEEIQFKAQYQHFRSIDYASIVNSAPALNTIKVEVEPLQEVTKNIRIAGENLTSKERQKLCWNFPKVKLRLFTAKSLEDILGRSSHNRKGHQSSECSSSGGAVGVGAGASSTNVLHNPNTNSNQNQNSDYSSGKLKQLLCKNAHTQSNSNLSIRDSGFHSKSKVSVISASNTPQVLSASSSENNCHYISGVAASSNSTSSSGHRKRTSTEENPSLSSPSLLSAVGLRKKSATCSPHLEVPDTEKNNSNSNNGFFSNKKSDVVVNSVGNVRKIIPRVKCAKSDNCLHRIVSTACTKLSSSSVDNLDTETKETKSKTPKSKKSKSDSNQKILSVSSDSLTTGLLPPLKLKFKSSQVQVEQLALESGETEKKSQVRFLKKQQKENSKKTLSAPKKKTQVSPVDAGGGADEIFNYNSSTTTTRESITIRGDTNIILKSPQEINQQLKKKISPSDEIPISTIINNNSSNYHSNISDLGNGKEDSTLNPTTTMTKDKAKLVVANVGYLQRPLSPTPATNFGFGMCPIPNFLQSSPSTPIPVPSSSSSYSSNFSNNNNPNNNTNTNHVFRSSHQQQKYQHQPPHSNTNTNTNMTNKNSSTLYSNLSPVESSSRHTNTNTNSNTNTNTNASQWPTPLSSASSSYPKCANLSYNYYSDGAAAGPGLSSDTGKLSSFQIQSKLDHDNTGLLQSTGLIVADRRRQQRLRALSPLPFPLPAEQINNNASPRLQHQHQASSNKCETSLKDQRNYSQNRLTGRQVDNGSNISSVLGQETSKETEMGDLQSPQYVKRTANMFDSRYTSKVNGSTVDEEHHTNGGDEALILQDSATHQYNNQPSYLNVSRSVSGYSCISYNNGTTTNTSSSITNGISSSINSYKPSRPSGVHSDFQIGYRPTATTTTTRFQTNNINNKSEFKSTNGNGHIISGGVGGGGNNREQKSSVLKSELISTEIANHHNSSGSYTPGRTASKNILEKIERLYGTNAAASTTLWRRPSPLISTGTSSMTTTTTQYSKSVPTTNNNITILNENQSNNKKSNEKIIPIVLESSISQQTRLGEIHEYANGSNVKSQTFKTVKHSSSSIDRDNATDKLNLYSNQDLLNANEQQKLHQHDLHDKSSSIEQKEDYSSSITPVISRTKSHSSKLNGNNFNHHHQQEHTIPVTREISELKSSIQKSQKVSSDITNNSTISLNNIIKSSPTKEVIKIETNMVSDTTPDSFAKKIIPTTNLKTEDTIDGDYKSTFKAVSNIHSENIEENAINKRLPTSNFTTTVTPLGTVDTDLKNTSEQKENVCCSGEPSAVEKNGDYFKIIVAKERSQIESLIKVAEARLEKLDTSDEQSAEYEFSGKILATIGKARLLVNKKFKQFEGLCNDNMEQRNKGSDEPFTTKNDDLAGFWDMVMIQVEQIHSMFENLDSTEGPKTLTKDTKIGNSSRKNEPVKKPAATKASTAIKSPGSSTRDELRRKMLNERRKAMKQQQQDSVSADIQIFAPDASSA